MREPREEIREREARRRRAVLWVLTSAFAAFAVVQLASPPAAPAARANTPEFDRALLDNAPRRSGFADLVRAGEDVSHFSCYLCHERDVAPVLRFDERHRVLVPEEHNDIVMAHGGHDRNNHCFNCHNERDRETFYIRDGRKLAFDQSSLLCGSCHGPTFADWEAGAHGRTSGYWDRTRGPAQRLDCVNCHDPHSPKIPTREPLPAPQRAAKPVPRRRSAACVKTASCRRGGQRRTPQQRRARQQWRAHIL